MAEAKKKPVPKQVIDVHKPGKTAASATAKPVIVTNRQILRDPMVTDEATTPIDEPKVAPSIAAKVVAPPLSKTATQDSDADSEEPESAAPVSAAVIEEAGSEHESESTETEAEKTTEPEKSSDTTEDDTSKTDAAAEKAETDEEAAIAEHDAAIQKLQPVIGPLLIFAPGKTGFQQRVVEDDAGIIAGERAARGIGAFEARREAHDKKLRIQRAEARHGGIKKMRKFLPVILPKRAEARAFRAIGRRRRVEVHAGLVTYFEKKYKLALETLSIRSISRALI